MGKGERRQGSKVLKEIGDIQVAKEEQNARGRQPLVGNPETVGHRMEKSSYRSLPS